MTLVVDEGLVCLAKLAKPKIRRLRSRPRTVLKIETRMSGGFGYLALGSAPSKVNWTHTFEFKGDIEIVGRDCFNSHPEGGLIERIEYDPPIRLRLR